ncbi:MAG: tryptophanase [Candidatus Peregrinibacteria bacterium]
MSLVNLLKTLPDEASFPVKPRPFVNHSVEFKKPFTPEQRAKVLESVGLNVFYFPSEMITGCDFLSDSGTTTMTNEQWAALHLGDESYGSNRGYFKLMEQIREIFGEGYFNDPDKGKPNAFIFHQGRPSEDALFTQVGRLGQNMIIPSNGHFDTTQANIEANGIQALNLFSPDLKDPNLDSMFKGDIDLPRLKELLEKDHGKVPLVYLTITNNTGGGQPVSLQNIKETAQLAHYYNIPFFLDACRFAENAYFIQKNEKSQQNKSIKHIVKDVFSYADGFTISFKKDGLVNMGGGLFIKDSGLFAKLYPQILEELFNYQIIKEGHPTYGGLSGRDIMSLAVGLQIVTKKEYLEYRVSQTQQFAEDMSRAGLPALTPSGAHAVYLDMNKFFEGTRLTPEDFGGVSFTALLLSAYGHRACELGNFAFGSYNSETNKETFPEVNFVRFAIPRLRYEKQDLDSAVLAAKALYENRDLIPPVEVTHGKNLSLRHFKARFRFKA